jgi:hypothetical protein
MVENSYSKFSLKTFYAAVVSLAFLISNLNASDSENPSSDKAQLLKPNPTKVSFVVADPNSDYRASKYGHASLRFSYGEKLSGNDIMVDFNPNKGKFVPFDFLKGLGIKKSYEAIVATGNFASTHDFKSKERLTTLTNYSLNLSSDERNKLVHLVNSKIENGFEKPYHGIIRNCVTMPCTEVNESLGKNVICGVGKYVPAFLGDVLEDEGLLNKATVYQNSSILRAEIVEELPDLNFSNEHAFLAANLKEQLNSKSPEDRMLAFWKLRKYLSKPALSAFEREELKLKINKLIELEPESLQSEVNQIFTLSNQEVVNQFKLPNKPKIYVKGFKKILSSEIVHHNGENQIKVRVQVKRRLTNNIKTSLRKIRTYYIPLTSFNISANTEDHLAVEPVEKNGQTVLVPYLISSSSNKALLISQNFNKN